MNKLINLHSIYSMIAFGHQFNPSNIIWDICLIPKTIPNWLPKHFHTCFTYTAIICVRKENLGRFTNQQRFLITTRLVQCTMGYNTAKQSRQYPVQASIPQYRSSASVRHEKGVQQISLGYSKKDYMKKFARLG